MSRRSPIGVGDDGLVGRERRVCGRVADFAGTTVWRVPVFAGSDGRSTPGSSVAPALPICREAKRRQPDQPNRHKVRNEGSRLEQHQGANPNQQQHPDAGRGKASSCLRLVPAMASPPTTIRRGSSPSPEARRAIYPTKLQPESPSNGCSDTWGYTPKRVREMLRLPRQELNRSLPTLPTLMPPKRPARGQ